MLVLTSVFREVFTILSSFCSRNSKINTTFLSHCCLRQLCKVRNHSGTVELSLVYRNNQTEKNQIDDLGAKEPPIV